MVQAQTQGHEAAKAQGAGPAAVGAKRPAELMSVVADNLIKRVRRVRNLGHGEELCWCTQQNTHIHTQSGF